MPRIRDYNDLVNWNSPYLKPIPSGGLSPTSDPRIANASNLVNTGITVRPNPQLAAVELEAAAKQQQQNDKDLVFGRIFKKDDKPTNTVSLDAAADRIESAGNFLSNLLHLLGGATTSEQIQVGDMARNITGTLPTLADLIRNLYATNVSRELGLDQNAMQRDVAEINVGGQKYVADQNLAGVKDTNQNRLKLEEMNQANQRIKEQLFQNLIGAMGSPALTGIGTIIDTIGRIR